MLHRLIDRLFIKQPRLRRVITKCVYGSSDRQTRVLDLDLRINTEKENGYFRASRLAARSSLIRDEIPVLMNICSLIEDGVTFVDIGANIGIYSSVVSRLGKIKRGVSVLAFEVDPDTYSRLDSNASRHGFTAYNVGISSKTGKETFVRGAVSHVTTRADLQNEYSIAGDKFSAQCRTLSSCELPGDKLVIKVDVEGAEMEVVEGARPLFEAGRIKAIYFDGIRDQAGVRDFLSSIGFEFFDARTLEKAGPYTFSLLALRASDAPPSIGS